MKTLFSCTLIFLVVNCFAQQQGSYLITLEGEKIIIADDKAEMSEDHISFNSVDKKNQYMKQSNIQLLVLGKRQFERLPIYGGDKGMRLQELVASSENYKLSVYWDDGLYYYIFDKNNTQVTDKIHYYNKKSEVELQSTVEKYFKDCKNLIQVMKENKASGKDLFMDVYNLKCEQ